MRTTALALACLLSLAAHAYTVTDANAWTTQEVKFTVSGNDELKQATRSAFKAWAKVCGLKFKEVSTGAQIYVCFAEVPPNYAGYAHKSQDSRNRSTVWFLAINGALEAHQLKAVVLHEIGHAIGIEHSNVPDAVMSTGSDSDELHDDDIRAAQALYGKPK